MNKDINITESATKQIQNLILNENKSDTFFRIRVNGGGCAGFQYNFTFTDHQEDHDLIIEKNKIKILIDDISFNLLKGSTIDYVDELIGSSFKINNPQATSSCGCGTSFSI
ncbi:MAG: Iron-sulfur cluster insertion protein ErpA [Alphaproteobacteria bacterium MarineAlpha5_Bin12]|nr:iron-sulfur cluster insertion protein ErpA [Pelagibacteraceae bacterium]PPR41868.1 MAG: Iron-sulfur cluster insertion protein ErpA [Alphaproteobacteria bacterium MarineAlpha5_Bin12]|tara:strand:- start:8429 stop:8761 length:333 start_codon:yes stop_codon:yes gene_type:complete